MQYGQNLPISFLFINGRTPLLEAINEGDSQIVRFLLQHGLLNLDIDKLNFSENKIRIISNYDANIYSDNTFIKKNLQFQMANKVRWSESIKKLEEIEEKILDSRTKSYEENKVLEKYFTGLKEEIAALPEVKYYDTPIRDLKKEVSKQY